MTHPQEDPEGIDAERNGPAPASISPVPITKLPADVLQSLELQRQFVQVIGAIGSMSWGKGLTPGIRRSIAEYCRAYDVDPLTELDVLGGSFYVNSEWYLRKLGDLRRLGIVQDFWLEHIQADPRLKALIDDTSTPEPIREEARRRWTDAMFKRVEHNAPETAEAVCVCYIVLPQGGHPIKGCKWGGNQTSIKQPRGRDAGGGSAPNPIVENNAALSVESQSVRRAMRQVQSHVSKGTIPDVEGMEADLTSITARMSTVVDAQEAVNDRLDAEHHEPIAVITSGAAPYGQGTPVVERQREGEPAMVWRAGADGGLDARDIEHAARQPDPYTGEVRLPPGLPMRESSPIVLNRDGSFATSAPTTKFCRKCGGDLAGVTPQEWFAGEHRDDCTPQEFTPRPVPASVAEEFERVGEEMAAKHTVEGMPAATIRKCGECGELVPTDDPSKHRTSPLCSKYAD